MLAPVVALAGMQQALSLWNNRQGRIDVIAQARVLQQSVMAAAQAAAALGGFAGVAALVLSQSLAALLAPLWLLRRGARWRRATRLDRAGKTWHWRHLRRLGWRYKQFPLLNSPHAFVNAAQETLVLAMIAAHQGLLDARVVALVAMGGTYLGDLAYYVTGLKFGRPFLDRFPRVDAKVQRIKGWIVKYDIAIIIVNRFLYGFRIAAPVALGTSAVPVWRFLVFNIAGAIIWTVVIGGAGYLFGSALEKLLEDVRWHDQILIGLVLLLGISLWIGRYIARRVMRGG